mmetsp:Transcript_56909/g.65204  ORF Transcript_56909/g.65204 Transcript_56909/m.65204 type:complete len:247 (-) Transcript_56909:84-824(-)
MRRVSSNCSFFGLWGAAMRSYNVRAAPNQGGDRGFGSGRRGSFEVSEVSDDPTKGFMLRVTYEDKRVSMTLFPQLGPRKVDPMDPAPQFDADGRQQLRFYPDEYAGFLAVCEGHSAQQRVNTRFHDVTFEKLPSNAFCLSGTISKKTTPQPFQISFDGYRFTMLKHFLEDALSESFGFSRVKPRQNYYNNGNNYQNSNSNNSSNYQSSNSNNGNNSQSSNSSSNGSRGANGNSNVRERSNRNFGFR